MDWHFLEVWGKTKQKKNKGEERRRGFFEMQKKEVKMGKMNEWHWFWVWRGGWFGWLIDDFFH